MATALTALGVIAFLGVIVGAVGLLLGLIAAFTSSGGPAGDGAKAIRWAKISAIVLGVAAFLLVVFVGLSVAVAPVA